MKSMMGYLQEIHQKLLLGLIVITLFVSGCASNRVILHPIQDSDIKQMKKGVLFAPAKQGWFLSDEYMAEVAKAVVK